MVIKLVPFWKTVWQYMSSAASFDIRPFRFHSVHYLLRAMVQCQLRPESPIYQEEFNENIYIFCLFFFRERGRVGEQEGEKHRYVRETWIGCLSHAPNRGPGPPPRYVPDW